jgi:hypothetical protein
MSLLNDNIFKVQKIEEVDVFVLLCLTNYFRRLIDLMHQTKYYFTVLSSKKKNIPSDLCGSRPFHNKKRAWQNVPRLFTDLGIENIYNRNRLHWLKQEQAPFSRISAVK